MDGPHVYMLVIYRCPRFPLQPSLLYMEGRVCTMTVTNGNVLEVEGLQSEIDCQEQYSLVLIAEIAALRGTSSVALCHSGRQRANGYAYRRIIAVCK